MKEYFYNPADPSNWPRLDFLRKYLIINSIARERGMPLILAPSHMA
jgi:hypothetical protein